MNAPDLGKLTASPTASPHWEWRPGMRDVTGWTIVGRSASGHLLVALEGDRELSFAIESRLRPDLAHGGTQGEMVVLVRKAWAWGSDGVRVDIAIFEDGSAIVRIIHDDSNTDVEFSGDHLGLAIAAALLAAPRKAGES